MITDWNETAHGEISEDDAHYVMALTFQYLCPKWVSFLGFGAIAAATMSSADSCILAAASLFTTNIYKAVLRPNAGDREMLWCIRIVIAVVGIIGIIFSIIGNSVYLLSVLSNELPYLVMFPHLMCILYIDFTNTYGAIAGVIVGGILRFGGGEPALSLTGFIPYPGNYIDKDGKTVQGFPVKTFAMLSDFVVVIFVSWLTKHLYRKKIITNKMDIAQCFHKRNKGSKVNIALADEEQLQRDRLL